MQMLENSFYIIVDLNINGNNIHATIELNQQHSIFKGHFPNQPIVPGVCMMQIAKEILQKKMGKQLQLTKAGELKFLNIIVPKQQKKIAVKIDYSFLAENTIDANSIFNDEQSIFCKLKCSYIFQT